MAPNESDRKCTKRIIEVIPRTMRTIRREMRAQRSDLSVPQFRLLIYLSRGSRSNREAADWLGVTAPTASRMIGTLVGKGLVKRESFKGDARQLSLSLTAKGSERLSAMRETVQESLAPRLAGLSSDDRRVLLRGLDVLASIFPGDDE